MKTRNMPIPVIAGFSADGTIQPLSFRHERKEYRVKLVKWWKYGSSLWSDTASRIYCVCTDDDSIAEIELLIEVGVWRLLKM